MAEPLAEVRERLRRATVMAQAVQFNAKPRVSPEALAYGQRHGIKSEAVLTVFDAKRAALVARTLMPYIAGKTVVEIGAGIGLLALQMGAVARRVYCIEANPVWSWAFAETLLRDKPKNVSFLFGAAEEFVDAIKGDIAVFCTHSDSAGMAAIAARFAPVVIDVYRDLVPEDPK